MINSKKIDFIAIILVILSIVFISFIYINSNKNDEINGEVILNNGHSIEYTDIDYYSDYLLSSYEKIKLNGDTAETTSKNVEILNSTITIRGGGIYEIEGTLNNGNIVVDIENDSVLRLVLKGVNITSEETSPINIKNSKKTVISLIDGTENVFTDGSEYIDTESDAVIYSKDDIVINGTGSLIINSNYEDGIKSNDNIKIIEGNIEINSVDEGISANDYISILGGNFNLNTTGHAIKCENKDDETLGFIVIDGGKFNIDSQKDAIHANSDLYINDIEAVINTDDDAVHSNKNLYLNGGNIDVQSCYEGFEGVYIEVNDGNFRVISNDDIMNATGENSSGNFGRPPMHMGGGGTLSSDIYLTINGGTLYGETGGDGVDSNAGAVINGGYIEIYGPENSGNSSLDFDGGFVINGGTVIAAGSSGMAESPNEQSLQNSLVVILSQSYDSGTKISLFDENNEEIISGISNKRFNWVCLSSDKLNLDSSYILKVGDVEETNVKLSSVVTSVQNGNGGGFGNFGGMNRLNKGNGQRNYNRNQDIPMKNKE